MRHVILKNREYVKQDKTFQKYLEFEEIIKRLVAELNSRKITLAFDGKISSAKTIQVESQLQQVSLDFETWLEEEKS